jgi:hypothetical protein
LVQLRGLLARHPLVRKIWFRNDGGAVTQRMDMQMKNLNNLLLAANLRTELAGAPASAWDVSKMIWRAFLPGYVFNVGGKVISTKD